MTDVRLSRALCAVVGDALATSGSSHPTLDALFESAGAPGGPPNLAHHSKWKTWLFQAGTDASVDSLAVLGNVLEEYMDVPPSDETDAFIDWIETRKRVVEVLEEAGLRYFRGGRVLPIGEMAQMGSVVTVAPVEVRKPDAVEDLLLILLHGLRRAMYPLTHRRKGMQSLSFESEYDVQDLLHALLRPWVSDIRPEEFTPSYAGTSTRMDFLLSAHSIVIETKFVRDRTHAKEIGNELIIDIEHYRRHPKCQKLWCVVYDPQHFIQNSQGLVADLEGERAMPAGRLSTKVLVL